jgi:hypothetical protein
LTLALLFYNIKVPLNRPTTSRFASFFADHHRELPGDLLPATDQSSPSVSQTHCLNKR